MMSSRPLTKFRSVNSDASAFRALAPEFDLVVGDAGTAAGRCLIRLADQYGNGVIPYYIDLYPYGLGADGDVVDFRLIGWKRYIPLQSTGRQFWVPTILGQVTATLSTFVGLATAPVIETERFADTIVKGIEPTETGNTSLLDGEILYYSPANNTPGHVLIPLQGYEVIELEGDPTTGTPTTNALYCLCDCH